MTLVGASNASELLRDGEFIALRSARSGHNQNGTCAWFNGYEPQTSTNGLMPEESNIFRLEAADGGKFYLKQKSSGLYVSVSSDNDKVAMTSKENANTYTFLLRPDYSHDQLLPELAGYLYRIYGTRGGAHSNWIGLNVQSMTDNGAYGTSDNNPWKMWAVYNISDRSTVTVTVNFNGKGWSKSYSEQLAPGSDIPAVSHFLVTEVPSTYYSVTGYPTGAVPEDDVTYDVTVTENLPFDAAPDYEHIVWHSLWLKGNMLNANTGSDTYINAGGSTDVGNTTELNKKMWGFVGNVVDGFKIYNRYAGSTKILSSSTTMSGTTGDGTYPLLTTESEIGEGANTYWIPTPGHSDYPGGFFLAQKGNSNNRMNARNVSSTNRLAYWTGGADGGSTFLAYSSEAFQLSNAPVDGVWAANTHWYVIKVKNGRYLTSQATESNVKQAQWTTAPTAADFSAIWCVTGSSSEGYVLYNRAHGTSVALAFNEGDTDANDSKFTATGLKLYTVPSNSRINGMADHKGGYICIRKSNADDATNFVQSYQGVDNALGTWNAIGNITDTGSNYQFVAIDDLKDVYSALRTEATPKTSLYADALNAGASYFVPSAASVTALTAAVAVAPESLTNDEELATAYSNLKRAVDAYDSSFETNQNLDGKYVLIGNKEHTTLYVTGPESHTKNTDRGTGLGSRATLAWDAVWKLEKNDNDGTYCLYNEFKGKYVGDVPGTRVDDQNDKRILWADTKDAAGKYEVAMSSDKGYVYFKTTKSDAYATRDCLHMTNWDAIVRWSDAAGASHFLLKDANEWAGNTYSNAVLTKASKIDYVKSTSSENRIGTLKSATAVSDAVTALTENKASYAAYTALDDALYGSNRRKPEAGKVYTIKNANHGNYLVEDYDITYDEGTHYGVNVADKVRPAALWTITEAENLYSLQNANSKLYLSSFRYYDKARMVTDTETTNLSYNFVRAKGLFTFYETKHDNTDLITVDGTVAIRYNWIKGDGNTDSSTLTAGTSNVASWNAANNGENNWIITEAEDIPVHVGSAQYATAYLPVAVTAPAESEGVVYRAQGEGSDYVSLAAYAEDDVIPAKTGVIIYKETQGDVVLPIVYEGEGEGSLITGCLTPHTVAEGEEAYILADGMQGIGLYQVVSETDRTIAANKAYYTPTATAAAPAFRLSFNELATAIDAARNDGLIEGVTYNLRGERVQKAGGLVIVNGKKVMVK